MESQLRRRGPLMGIVLGVVVAAMLVVTAWFTWSGHDRQGHSAGQTDATLEVTELRVHHYAATGRRAGILGITSDFAEFGDSIRCDAKLSDPAYCFLVALNPDGGVQECLPGNGRNRIS